MGDPYTRYRKNSTNPSSSTARTKAGDVSHGSVLFGILTVRLEPLQASRKPAAWDWSVGLVEEDGFVEFLRYVLHIRVQCRSECGEGLLHVHTPATRQKLMMGKVWGSHS
jgi:hypothetical protein